jgi:hypothetical protein
MLGIPDGPHLVPPDDAPLDPGLSLASAGPPGAQAAAHAPADETPPNTPLEPVLGDATDDGDGGIASNLPLVAASLSPDADVPSTGSDALPHCPPLTRPAISDFTHSPRSSATSASFGTDAAFRGGTYFYPSTGSLSSSVLDDDWHLTGTVETISGFGLYSNACQPFEASAFTGIAFRLWGQIDADRQLSFIVESAAQQVSSSWINTHKANPTDPDSPANSGRCIPAASRYDGSCDGSRVRLSVSSEPVTILLPWADFAGGSPEATPDPREITAIAWSLPQPGDTPYAFDIHIDDLRFVVPAQ